MYIFNHDLNVDFLRTNFFGRHNLSHHRCVTWQCCTPPGSLTATWRTCTAHTDKLLAHSEQSDRNLNSRMATSSNKELWSDSGVFKFFNFTDEVIKHFTVDSNISRLEQREKKSELATQYVAGKCKTCKWESKVCFSNPYNWLRHLTKVMLSLPILL